MTGTGDRLVPSPRPDVTEYAPSAPKADVSARVLSMPTIKPLDAQAIDKAARDVPNDLLNGIQRLDVLI